jgi:hypothetical protein
MVSDAVNSTDFFHLFLDLCKKFAEALRFKWNWSRETATTEWTKWINANPLEARFLTIHVNGKSLTDNKFAQFVVETRHIELDIMLLMPISIQDPMYTPRVKFILFVKVLHEVAHFLTELILQFLKYMYRNEPYAKRKRIPTKTTPVKIGRLTKTKGDCGYLMEQLLTGNLRFTFEHNPYNPLSVREIVAISIDGKNGFYVPRNLIDSINADSRNFYSLMKNAFADHSQLQQVSQNNLQQLVFKCAKKWKRFPLGIKS